MRLSILALASALCIAHASPILEPGLKCDCVFFDLTPTAGVTVTVTVTYTEFKNAYEDFCENFSNRQLSTGEIYTTGDRYCTDNHCIVLYLAFTGRDRYGAATNGSMSYQDCASHFDLRPYALNITYCPFGWYSGAGDGRGSWSTEIVATTLDMRSVRPKTLLPAFGD